MTLRPETHDTAPWMVFSATPFRRYSTSGCQFGMARAKLTGRFSLNGTRGCYPQITQMCADEGLPIRSASMELDIFFSISQTEVDGYMPSERVMFENFFEQVELADRLGFG